MSDPDGTTNETLVHSYMGTGFLLLKLSPNRAELAALIADRWATIARLEKHEAEKARLDWRPKERRTPSGTMPAVIEDLKGHPEKDR